MKLSPALLAGCLIAMLALASQANAEPTLKVYGPGGPHLAISECAAAFSNSRGIEVIVIKGEPRKQAHLVAADGDVYYSGAEYMLREFAEENPGLLDEQTITAIAPRRIGIIVRQGNPKHIRSMADAAAPGVRVLDVALENMGALRKTANANVILSVTTGEQGFEAWNSRPDLDVWVTYKTWSKRLQSGEFLPIDGPEGVRHSPVAITNRTRQREAAEAFVSYLKSDEARAILQKFGYD